MKLFSIAVLVVMSFGYKPCQARTGRVVEDLMPSSVNQYGKEYSQVNSQKKVRAEIATPVAKKVRIFLLDKERKQQKLFRSAVHSITGLYI